MITDYTKSCLEICMGNSWFELKSCILIENLQLNTWISSVGFSRLSTHKQEEESTRGYDMSLCFPSAEVIHSSSGWKQKNVLWSQLKGRKEGRSILTLYRKRSKADKVWFIQWTIPQKNEHKHMASIILEITNQRMRLQLDVAKKSVQLSTKLQ